MCASFNPLLFLILLLVVFLPGFITVITYNWLIHCEKRTIKNPLAGFLFDLLILLIILVGLFIFKGVCGIWSLLFKFLFVSFIIKYVLAAIIIAVLIGVLLYYIEKHHEENDGWHLWCFKHHHKDC